MTRRASKSAELERTPQTYCTAAAAAQHMAAAMAASRGTGIGPSIDSVTHTRTLHTGSERSARAFWFWPLQVGLFFIASTCLSQSQGVFEVCEVYTRVVEVYTRVRVYTCHKCPSLPSSGLSFTYLSVNQMHMLHTQWSL